MPDTDELAPEPALLVAANRLPVAWEDGRWTRSPGGLASALVPPLQDQRGTWVGWGGTCQAPPRSGIIPGIDLVPVDIDADAFDDYYRRVSNGALWPLFHALSGSLDVDDAAWRSYVDVNRCFAETIAERAGDHGRVWIHDYHLLLVPYMVRSTRRDVRVGFFLHTPFPPPDVLARFPWAAELLAGMLGADLVGFQDPDSARNFIDATDRFLDAPCDDRRVLTADDRKVTVDHFPISIDVEAVDEVARTDRCATRASELRAELGDPDVLFVAVDRLDLTKGIPERLAAFSDYLAGPGAERRAKLVQVAVPTRAGAASYARLRADVERLVDAVNEEFGTPGDPVIHYSTDSLGLDELVALYRAADVMVVTPLNDGMNLVAKEFVASRIDADGVLVLSEFAGARRELVDAVITNPYCQKFIVSAFQEAAEMPAAERRRRMRELRASVRAHDVHDWAAEFLGELDAV